MFALASNLVNLDMCITSVYSGNTIMTTKTHKRINITLPAETVTLIEKVGADNRSAFINQAVKVYITRLQRASLKRKLKETYLAGATEERTLAAEWDYVSTEALARLEAEETAHS